MIPARQRVERKERARLKQVKFSQMQPAVIDVRLFADVFCFLVYGNDCSGKSTKLVKIKEDFEMKFCLLQESAIHGKKKKNTTFSRKFPFYKSKENLDEMSDHESMQLIYL